MSVYADQLDLLIAIRDRLRDQIDEFTAGTCFITDAPVPVVFPQRDPICTICSSDQQYDQAIWSGAAVNALNEHCPVLVTILIRSFIDSSDRSEQAIIHDRRGLLRWRRRVLRALLLSSTRHCEGYADVWIPTKDGNQFLVERGLRPQGCTSPRYVIQGDHSFVAMTLTFVADFDQDLQTPDIGEDDDSSSSAGPHI